MRDDRLLIQLADARRNAAAMQRVRTGSMRRFVDSRDDPFSPAAALALGEIERAGDTEAARAAHQVAVQSGHAETEITASQ